MSKNNLQYEYVRVEYERCFNAGERVHFVIVWAFGIPHSCEGESVWGWGVLCTGNSFRIARGSSAAPSKSER